MGVNEQLKKLYLRYFESAESAYRNQGTKLCNPLLIKINEADYQRSKQKIMVFGQETFGWHGEFGDQDIDFLMDDYLKYLTGDKADFSEDFSDDKDNYLNSDMRYNRRKRSSFWIAIRAIKRKNI